MTSTLTAHLGLSGWFKDAAKVTLAARNPDVENSVSDEGKSLPEHVYESWCHFREITRI